MEATHSSSAMHRPNPLDRLANNGSSYGTYVRAFSMVLGFLVLTTSLYPVSPGRDTNSGSDESIAANLKYFVIMDAGSSGTRVHVFRWDGAKPGIPDLQMPSHTLKRNPGLSSFANEPAAAGASLKELLEFAAQKVPPSKRPETPLFIKATAGLRRVETSKASLILDSCAKFVQVNSDFQFDRSHAAVISGQEEALLGWMAVNYLRWTAQSDIETSTRKVSSSASSVGTIEMGGASSQVTFALDSPGAAAVNADQDSKQHLKAVSMPEWGIDVKLYARRYA